MGKYALASGESEAVATAILSIIARVADDHPKPWLVKLWLNDRLDTLVSIFG